jgi:multidrug efflux pump subunit AcrB
VSFNPTGFFVRRWQFTLLIFALLAALGLDALRTTPRSEDPQFPNPTIFVRVSLPGAGPVEIEQLVVKPIEDAIYRLDDVKVLRATSYDGAAVLRTEFTWDTDPERKYDEIVREITALRPELPRGVTRLEVQRSRTSETAIVEAALVSDHLPMRHLEKLAQGLRDELDRLPGVSKTAYWGVPPSEARVSLDLGRMAQLQVSPQQVVAALRARGAEGPVGSVHAGARRFDIKTGGAFTRLDEIAATPLARSGAGLLRVGDVARVTWAQAETDHLTRFNGRRAVILTASAKDGADVSRVTERLRAAFRDVPRTLPAGVRLETAFFQADNVKVRLDHLTRDFAIALGLVLVTLLPLGLRAGTVVMISIPLSLLIGLALMHALGFTLNQVSIAGFILALGLLVDDSIVVIENISRRLRAGADRVTAAVAGTAEITLAVAGCTACLMLAFLPLIMLPEASGAFIRSLPAAVLCTVGASFVISLTIIPFLASRLLPSSEPPDGNRFLRGIDRAIQTAYRPTLRWGLAHPRRTLLALGAVCALSVPLLGAIGTSLFPPADLPQFLVRVEAPRGASLLSTDAALRHIERQLASMPAVKWYISNLGRGNPIVFYNTSQHQSDPRFAEVLVSLASHDGEKSRAVIEALRTRLARYAGAKLTVLTFENGPAIDAPVAVRISGEDLGQLKALAQQVQSALSAVPGTRDVDNPVRIDRTDLNLAVDEAKAGLLGIPVGAVRATVQMALSGEEAARLRDADGDDYPVRVRIPMGQRNELSALDGIYVQGTTGAAAPLRALTAPILQSAPARIDHFNRARTVTVTAFVKPGFLTSAVTREAVSRLKREVRLPPGYAMSFGGEAEVQATSFAGLGAAVMVAVFGILAVLVLEFGAFRSALVVAGVIPLGIFGALAALWVAGYSLSFTAMIGLVALIGIEIKNSILLVDFTEQARREGAPLALALEQAGETRFLPVLLTSVTAIGGFLPLALGGSALYAPMAVALIGGLAASTVLSRVATPVMYLLLARKLPQDVGAHAGANTR